MPRPVGQEAIDFLEEWDDASYDIINKTKLCIKYNGSDRLLRGWASDIRKDLALQNARPISESKKHRNQFIKQSPSPTIMTLNTNGGSKTILNVNDAHCPFQDDATLDLIISFASGLQPDYINFKGDWADWYQISKFNKDPKRITHLQDDLDIAKDRLKRFRDACPDSKLIYELGNHDDRLRKYLWMKAPELSSLRGTDIRELLGFGELEIDCIPSECLLEINGIFQSEHGEVVSKHSGWTAKAMFEKRGGSGICGHSHRGGSYFKHDSDYFGWWENFCTCTLNPQWTKNPNWMQGFSLVHFIEKRFYVEQIPIIKHKFVYAGELFE